MLTFRQSMMSFSLRKRKMPFPWDLATWVVAVDAARSAFSSLWLLVHPHAWGHPPAFLSPSPSGGPSYPRGKAQPSPEEAGEGAKPGRREREAERKLRTNLAHKGINCMNNTKEQTIKKPFLRVLGTYHPILFLEINLPS